MLLRPAIYDKQCNILCQPIRLIPVKSYAFEENLWIVILWLLMPLIRMLFSVCFKRSTLHLKCMDSVTMSDKFNGLLMSCMLNSLAKLLVQISPRS